MCTVQRDLWICCKCGAGNPIALHSSCPQCQHPRCGVNQQRNARNNSTLSFTRAPRTIPVLQSRYSYGDGDGNSFQQCDSSSPTNTAAPVGVADLDQRCDTLTNDTMSTALTSAWGDGWICCQCSSTNIWALARACPLCGHHACQFCSPY